MQLDDFVRSLNRAAHPDLYEVENRAMDRDGLGWGHAGDRPLV